MVKKFYESKNVIDQVLYYKEMKLNYTEEERKYIKSCLRVKLVNFIARTDAAVIKSVKN